MIGDFLAPRGQRAPARTLEAGLTGIYVDSGALVTATRSAAPAWKASGSAAPFLAAGRSPARHGHRHDGKPDYTGSGQYAMASWVLTGESHPYNAGAVANIKPAHDYGAVGWWPATAAWTADDEHPRWPPARPDPGRELVPDQPLQIPGQLREGRRQPSWCAQHAGDLRTARADALLTPSTSDPGGRACHARRPCVDCRHVLAQPATGCCC